MATQTRAKGLLGVLASMLTVTLSACSQLGVTTVEQERSPEAVESVSDDAERGKLTVKEAGQGTPDPGFTLAETKKFPDIEFEAWIGEDVALVSAENRDLPQYDSYVNGMVYPRSIYFFDINTADLTPALERPGVNLSVGAVSPGGRYVTISEYVVGDNELSVLDIETGKTVDLSTATHAYWVDPLTVAGYDFHQGEMFTYKVGDAGPSKMNMPPDLLTPSAVTADYVYYSNEDNQFRRFDRATGEVENIGLKNVGGAQLSPDETQLAVSVYTESDTEELYVCDLLCHDPELIAEGAGPVAWSPNMQMLAYGTSEGLFVKDFLFGETTPILLGVDFFRIEWNTNSKRIGIPTVDKDGRMQGAVVASLSGPATE